MSAIAIILIVLGAIVYGIVFAGIVLTLTTDSTPWRVAAWLGAFLWPLWLPLALVGGTILWATGGDD